MKKRRAFNNVGGMGLKQIGCVANLETIPENRNWLKT